MCVVYILQKDVVTSYSGSLTSAESKETDTNVDMSIGRVLDALLDPYVPVFLSKRGRSNTDKDSEKEKKRSVKSVACMGWLYLIAYCLWIM